MTEYSKESSLNLAVFHANDVPFPHEISVNSPKCVWPSVACCVVEPLSPRYQNAMYDVKQVSVPTSSQPQQADMQLSDLLIDSNQHTRVGCLVFLFSLGSGGGHQAPAEVQPNRGRVV